mgnify:FL=1
MIIVLDTETTGLLEPEATDIKLQPKIIEFAAIKLDHTADHRLVEVDRIEFKCNPEMPLPAIITKITGLKDEDVANAPKLIEKIGELQEFFVGSQALVAHNAGFDVGIIWYELVRLGLQKKFPWPPRHICTVESTMQIKGHRLHLADLHKHLFGEKFAGAHRAMVDVEALTRCFIKLVQDGEIIL